HHPGRHRHVRAGPRGDGQGLPRAPRRRRRHRGRLLRVGARAHPAHRRGRPRALPPLTAAVLRSPEPVIVDDLTVRIDRGEVLRFQGYKRGVDVPEPAVLALFDEALALGERLIAPRVVYRAAPVTAQGADWIEAGGERLTIPAIGRLWGPLE